MAEPPATQAGFVHAAPIRARAANGEPGPSGLHLVTGRSSWSWVIRYALCRYVSVDPDQWFPAGAEAERARQQAPAAIAICQGCTARAQCLAMSLQWESASTASGAGLVSAERATLRNRILSN